MIPIYGHFPGDEGSKLDLQITISDWEQFTIIRQSNRRYAFLSHHNTYIRAFPGGKGSKVDLQTHASDWEKFSIIRLSNGRYAIRSHDNTYLRAYPGGEGSKIDLQTNISSWETFEFVWRTNHHPHPHPHPHPNPNPNPHPNPSNNWWPLAAGRYKIICMNTGKSLYIQGASPKRIGIDLGSLIHGDDDQQFNLVPTNKSGVYYIFIRHSGKVLHVTHFSNENVQKIEQHLYNGRINQQWKIIHKTMDIFLIKSMLSGKTLSVRSDSPEDCAPLYRHDVYGGYSQRFKFVRI